MSVTSPIAILAPFPLSGTKTSGADNIKVEVNGHSIDFDVPPVIINGRTLVPVRKIADALGCTTNWDPSGYVTVENNNTYIYFEINNKVAYVDGEEYLLDVPPMIIGDRSLVPLRFISEALGLNVDWDDNSRLITISAD
ncbi:MAG: copper amine oxidase N-terminal domain-containing protein [Desulfotomaculaceae bacterium]|nr:copper amine oxidase N-terminal domain-containing protein [Desulfotomaculaceae bacterium]